MRQTSLETYEDTNGKIRTIISKEYCGKILVPNPRPGVPVRLYGSSQILSPGLLKEARNAPPTFCKHWHLIGILIKIANNKDFLKSLLKNKSSARYLQLEEGGRTVLKYIHLSLKNR